MQWTIKHGFLSPGKASRHPERLLSWAEPSTLCSGRGRVLIHIEYLLFPSLMTCNVGSTIRYQFPSECSRIRSSPVATRCRHQRYKVWKWKNIHLWAKACLCQLEASKKGLGQDITILRRQTNLRGHKERFKCLFSGNDKDTSILCPSRSYHSFSDRFSFGLCLDWATKWCVKLLNSYQQNLEC